MIKRFQLIRNIGKFDSCSASPGTELNKLTLIYAENAKGKTTLCSILRSLALGDSDIIIERSRLGSSNPPHVVINLDNDQTTAVFQNSSWSKIYPNIIIFDDFFIFENIYSGLKVEANHRYNLHEVIIGKQGVSIAKQVEKLTEKISDFQSKIREKSEEITSDLRGEFTVDEFCQLSEIKDIDNLILKTEKSLAALQDANEVQTKKLFDTLKLPEISIESLEKILIADFPKLDSENVKKVTEHINALGHDLESWINQGYGYLPKLSDFSNISCPFCGQNLKQSTLVLLYRDYFSDAYAKHKQKISEILSKIDNDFSGASLSNLQLSIENLRELHRFWSKYVNLPIYEINMEFFVDSWQNLKNSLLSTLNRKILAPLEIIRIDEELISRYKIYTENREKLIFTNNLLLECNKAIVKIKSEVAKGNIDEVKERLERIKTTKIRYSKEVKDKCEEYINLKNIKKQTEKGKNEAREKLDQHRNKIFPKYQNLINEFLSKFNADFRIVEVQAVNPRGLPSIVYNLEINSCKIPVGSTSQDLKGSPSFKNTLSSGDRNTLALAFFFCILIQ